MHLGTNLVQYIEEPYLSNHVGRWVDITYENFMKTSRHTHHTNTYHRAIGIEPSFNSHTPSFGPLIVLLSSS